jgi:hypothetical protein
MCLASSSIPVFELERERQRSADVVRYFPHTRDLLRFIYVCTQVWRVCLPPQEYLDQILHCSSQCFLCLESGDLTNQTA